MKRLLFLLIAVVTIGWGTAQAMSYEEARQEAWFLTDKMAYELNLTPEQYDRAYQVNLDYLMSINTPSDCYGYYWNYRDADLRCILFDWQYTLYATLDYFYRPIRWIRSSWYYPVFDRYRRGYYYFNRPAVYVSYRGGMWRRRGHNDVSPYRGMTFRPGRGMRDNYPGTGRPPHRPEMGRPGYRPDRPQAGPRPDNNKKPSRPDNDGRPNRPSRPGNQGGDNKRPDNGGRPTTGRGNGNRGGGTYSRPGGSNYRPSRDAGNGRSGSSRSASGTSQNSGRTMGSR